MKRKIALGIVTLGVITLLAVGTYLAIPYGQELKDRQEEKAAQQAVKLQHRVVEALNRLEDKEHQPYSLGAIQRELLLQGISLDETMTMASVIFKAYTRYQMETFQIQMTVLMSPYFDTGATAGYIEKVAKIHLERTKSK